MVKLYGARFTEWSHGLAVRTLDSESSNPSSSLGWTFLFSKTHKNISLKVVIDSEFKYFSKFYNCYIKRLILALILNSNAIGFCIYNLFTKRILNSLLLN